MKRLPPVSMCIRTVAVQMCDRRDSRDQDKTRVKEDARRFLAIAPERQLQLRREESGAAE
jgi:hypothetical protein